MTPEGPSCPSCGKLARQTVKTSGKDAEVQPGHFAVCGGCGGLLQFDENRRLVVRGKLPGGLSKDTLILMVRLWALASHGDAQAQYAFGVALVQAALRRWLDQFPFEKPRFALPSSEIGVIAMLKDIGPAIAKNDAAAAVIDAAIGYCKAAGAADPTLLMLKIAIDQEEDIPIEEASLADLGLIPKDAPS